MIYAFATGFLAHLCRYSRTRWFLFGCAFTLAIVLLAR